MRYNYLVFIVLLAAASLMGCVTAGKPPQQAMDAANVTADRMFDAFNTDDHVSFSQNFSEAMRSGMNRSRFEDVRSGLAAKYGTYVSRSPVPSASTVQGYNVFLYDCRFEKGNLTIQLTMNATDAWKVEGLFFR